MALSLRGRLLTAYAIVIATALVIMTVMATDEQHRWLIALQQDGLERTAAQTVAALGTRIATAGEQAPGLADSLGRALGCRVTLIDSGGWVRGDSEVDPAALAQVENHAHRPEVRAALAGHVGRAREASREAGGDRRLAGGHHAGHEPDPGFVEHRLARDSRGRRARQSG